MAHSYLAPNSEMKGLTPHTPPHFFFLGLLPRISKLLLIFFVLFMGALASLAAGGRRSEPEPPPPTPQSSQGSELILPVPSRSPRDRNHSGELPVYTYDSMEESLSNVFQVLDDLILSAGVEGPVLMVYSRVRLGINEDRVRILFDDEDPGPLETPEEFFASVFFAAEPGSPTMIVVTRRFLELTQLQPSLAFALLIEAMAYASQSILLGDQYLSNFENPVEQFLYSMDALYLKALFVSQYLVGAYPLSAYEEYLLEGLEADNLASVALFFRGVDLDMIYGLLEQANGVRDEIITLERFLEQLSQLVDLITEQHQNAFAQSAEQGLGDDQDFLERTRYITTVSTGTYIKYGIWIVNDLLLDLQNLIQASQELTEQVRNINTRSAQLYQRFIEAQYSVVPFRSRFIQSFFPF